jgi:hypothetical protein
MDGDGRNSIGSGELFGAAAEAAEVVVVVATAVRGRSAVSKAKQVRSRSESRKYRPNNAHAAQMLLAPRIAGERSRVTAIFKNSTIVVNRNAGSSLKRSGHRKLHGCHALKRSSFRRLLQPLHVHLLAEGLLETLAEPDLPVQRGHRDVAPGLVLAAEVKLKLGLPLLQECVRLGVKLPLSRGDRRCYVGRVEDSATKCLGHAFGNTSNLGESGLRLTLLELIFHLGKSRG